MLQPSCISLGTMRISLLLLLSMLLAGCLGTESGHHLEKPGRTEVQDSQYESKAKLTPACQGQNLQAPEKRQSRPGTFCGDREVSDDF